MAGRSLAYLSGIPVDAVKGIGPRTAAKLGDAGIHSVTDLLLHAPRRYLDRSQLFNVSQVPLGEEVTVAGTVMAVRKRRISRKRTMTEAVVGDDDANVLTAVWFNPYLRINEGAEVVLSGRAERFRGRLQMKNPDMDLLDEEDSLVTGRVVPVHPSLAGLGPQKLRVSIDNALKRSRPLHEVLPADMLERIDLIDRDRAIADVHFPESAEHAAVARRRLVFDELFRLEIALALRRQRQFDEATGVAHQADGELVDRFLRAFPHQLTGAQHKAIAEISADLQSPHPMHRLLQGEVGSGKTLVALAALLSGVQGGYQGAVMAPTEVLATQHYLATRAMLEDAGLAPPLAEPPGAGGTQSLLEGDREGGVRLALLTSSNAEVNFFPAGSANRGEVASWIASADIDLVIGTHALIQEGIHFGRLGIAVVDEQHRFGVYQRVELREKGKGYDPDLLIMTATPIPRTLSMTLYGDLDVSVLDEMPPGRLPVQTIHTGKAPEALEKVYARIRNEAASGRQTFVVCPLVEESDNLAAKSATAEHERLQEVFPELRLGLLHGQLRPQEKQTVMQGFRAGEIDVLVATTVIEVGIDIPRATVMVIEDADRFGLSQLHQLRGRVGRGADPAVCILIAEPTTYEGEQRLAAMVSSNDGFRLAEEDLRIRGQGTVFGTRQSGVKDLKLADILRDVDVLVDARREAFAVVAGDPHLETHAEIAEEVRALLGEDVEWLFRS